jgi:hypothetical protein
VKTNGNEYCAIQQIKLQFKSYDITYLLKYQILEDFDLCDDTAKLWYNEGKLYLTRIETAKPRSDCTLKQKAIHCFKQVCINSFYIIKYWLAIVRSSYNGEH